MVNYEICDCYIEEIQEILIQKIYDIILEYNRNELIKMLKSGNYIEYFEEYNLSKEATLFYELYKVSGIIGG